jgi:hypothetical protein
VPTPTNTAYNYTVPTPPTDTTYNCTWPTPSSTAKNFTVPTATNTAYNYTMPAPTNVTLKLFGSLHLKRKGA